MAHPPHAAPVTIPNLDDVSDVSDVRNDVRAEITDNGSRVVSYRACAWYGDNRLPVRHSGAAGFL